MVRFSIESMIPFGAHQHCTSPDMLPEHAGLSVSPAAPPGNRLTEIEDEKPFADIHYQVHLVLDEENGQVELFPDPFDKFHEL